MELLSFRCCVATHYLLTSNYNESVTLNDRTTCGMKQKKPVANDSGQYLFAAVNIRKYSPANVGMAHSNQLNFLEHSEEPYNKYRYLHLIPNLQLTSAGRTGTANGPQIALGPHFAQVCLSRTFCNITPHERKGILRSLSPFQIFAE